MNIGKEIHKINRNTPTPLPPKKNNLTWFSRISNIVRNGGKFLSVFNKNVDNETIWARRLSDKILST